MKVFISWSGERSKKFAEFLYALFRKYNFGLDPWLSGPEISYGTRWRKALADALTGTHSGILCLTKNAQASPWVAFEAGALSKEEEISRVSPVLLDFHSFDDNTKYLEQFQYVVASFNAIMDMIKKLSAASEAESKMDSEMIAAVLNEEIENLEELLNAIAEVPAPKTSKVSQDTVTARQSDRVIDYLDSIDKRLSGVPIEFGQKTSILGCSFKLS